MMSLYLLSLSFEFRTIALFHKRQGRCPESLANQGHLPSSYHPTIDSSSRVSVWCRLFAILRFWRGPILNSRARGRFGSLLARLSQIVEDFADKGLRFRRSGREGVGVGFGVAECLATTRFWMLGDGSGEAVGEGGIAAGFSGKFGDACWSCRFDRARRGNSGRHRCGHRFDGWARLRDSGRRWLRRDFSRT